MNPNAAAIARVVSTEALLVRTEHERDRAFEAWLRTDPDSLAWSRALRRLNELDVQVGALEAQRFRFRAEARGERHLRVVR